MKYTQTLFKSPHLANASRKCTLWAKAKQITKSQQEVVKWNTIVMKSYIKLINNEMLTPYITLLKTAEWRHPVRMAKGIIRHFHQDSLYRNSIYLMFSTLVMAIFGFFFWIINTKLFSAEEIGLATALISSVTLIGGFSILGLNLGLVRYLPKSEFKTQKINTVFTVVLIASLLISLAYIYKLEYFAPKLLIIKDNFVFSALFIIMVVFFALDLITNSVFTAFRDTKYILIKSVIASIFKLAAPIFLTALGAYAIFISASFGSIITFFISLAVFYKYFGFKFKLMINRQVFSKMFKLSFGNYIASFTSSLPMTLMPILINNRLGSRQAAYYFMAMSIINLLLTVQKSVNTSLFAEGSTNDINLKGLIIKSIKFMAIFLIPSVMSVVLLGQYILLFFGKEYSTEGIVLLRLLALSVFFTTINGTLSSVLYLKEKVKLILIMCFIGPALVLILIHIALPSGLTALGVAWLLGEALISLIYSICVYSVLKVKGIKVNNPAVIM